MPEEKYIVLLAAPAPYCDPNLYAEKALPFLAQEMTQKFQKLIVERLKKIHSLDQDVEVVCLWEDRKINDYKAVVVVEFEDAPEESPKTSRVDAHFFSVLKPYEGGPELYQLDPSDGKLFRVRYVDLYEEYRTIFADAEPLYASNSFALLSEVESQRAREMLKQKLLAG